MTTLASLLVKYTPGTVGAAAPSAVTVESVELGESVALAGPVLPTDSGSFPEKQAVRVSNFICGRGCKIDCIFICRLEKL